MKKLNNISKNNRKVTRKLAFGKVSKRMTKLGYLVLLIGNLATAIFLAFMVSNPSEGLYILAMSATLSATYFTVRVVG